ncbi:MAG: HD domain-containing phosphohydrolase [Pseudomonadota bacterium]|nr:HD domain-containing phosphohydrolase [Pseudomonadota bacterium]
MEGASQSKVDVLVLGPSNQIRAELGKILTGYQPYNLVQYISIDRFLTSADDAVNPMLAIVSADSDTSKTCEWVQSAKMNFPHVPVLVLHDSNATLDFRKAKKNGASYVMHLHYDKEFISDRILQLAPIDIDGDKIPMSALIAIHVDDFEPGTKIDFNLYVHLPSNHKTIMFRRQGSVLDDKAIAKISGSAGQRVYVKKTQLRQFFKYATQVLKIRKAEDSISLTEKSQNVKSEIQTIMSYFLDGDDAGYEHGKVILERCEVILKELGVSKKWSPETMFKKIVGHCGQNESIYNDCMNLCAYGALFARVLECNEEDIRIAALTGLLGNIGLAGLSSQIHMKPKARWTLEEKAAFERYPIDSVLMIKRKKVPLPPEISKIIEQHRELLDGSGIPHKLKGTQISKLARIISIATKFQSLSSIKDDKISFTPSSALDHMVSENTKLQKMPLDPLMLQKLAAFMKIQTQKLGPAKIAS